jgi:hypothetical protein
VTTADQDNDLAGAIADVYGGPLEEFVRRRDALAKELRSADRRDDASDVEALRKPSRMAWALDVAVREEPDAFGRLEAAVVATLQAQAAGGGGVREAIASLREAVQEVAGHAARAAEAAGHRVERGVLGNAVLAVLGKTEAFDALRRGRLVDVPEGGGLDFLSSLPAPEPAAPTARVESTAPPAAPSRARKRADGEARAGTRKAARQPQAETRAATREAARRAEAEARAATREAARKAEAEAAAREAVRQAGLAVEAARADAEKARAALREVEEEVEAAEDRLRRLEAEVRALRGRRDLARRASEAATTRSLEARRALAEAEAKLDR